MVGIPGQRSVDESAFSTKILMSAPADLAVVRLSRKYRLLRRDLLKAFEDKAWGLEVELVSETPEKLKQQVHTLVNAGKSWEPR